MLPITGDTFEIRDSLKALGCKWEPAEDSWFARDEATRAQGQALADAEPWRKWRTFMDGLAWLAGAFTDTAFQAGLNGCSRGIPLDAAMAEIRARIAAAGKEPEPGWIERNVGRAYTMAEPPKQRAAVQGRGAAEDAPQPRAPKPKPVFEETHLTRFAGRWAADADAVWLADRSPLDVHTATPATFLAALYEPGEHVAVFDVFASQGQWMWSAEAGFAASVIDYQAWEGNDPRHESSPPVKAAKPFSSSAPQGIWYLCNPVDGAFHKQLESDAYGRPKWSRRWEACVTSWRYFVFESDDADPREWVGAIVQLPLPIAAIYTSGGSSIHVLVRVDAESKTQFDQWRDTAKEVMIPLGADKQCMSAVRLTRLPGCWRELDKNDQPWPHGPRAQRLLFLDPDPQPIPIIERAALRDTLGPWAHWIESLIERPRNQADEEEIAKIQNGLRQFRGARVKELQNQLRRWLS